MTHAKKTSTFFFWLNRQTQGATLAFSALPQKLHLRPPCLKPKETPEKRAARTELSSVSSKRTVILAIYEVLDSDTLSRVTDYQDRRARPSRRGPRRSTANLHAKIV